MSEHKQPVLKTAHSPKANQHRRRPLVLVLVVLLSGVLLFSLYKLGGILLEYRKGAREYGELTALAVTDTDTSVGSTLPEAPTAGLLDVDFGALRAINSDIIGWIDVPNTHISYPVVLGYDNDEYLRTSFEGKAYIGGTVFIDYLCQGDWSSANTVVYGHNMHDGTMFTDLSEFTKKDFFSANRRFYIYTEKSVLVYEIFSARRTTIADGCYEVLFQDDAALAAWGAQMKGLSKYGCDTAVKAGDRVVTLSTCTGEQVDERYVVQGVLIDTIAR